MPALSRHPAAPRLRRGRHNVEEGLLAARTRDGWTPDHVRGDGREGAPRQQRERLPCILQVFSRHLQRNRPHPSNPCLQSSPSRHGYAARRGSQAGSALLVQEGREPAPKGPAENGLPPATRGKRRGTGPTLSFHAPNGAPDVPVRHARRSDWRMRRHRPPGCKQSGRAKSFRPASPRSVVP